MALLQAMLTTVLPVFVLVGLGWLARLKLRIEVRDLSRVLIYILSPGLIMNSILKARLDSSEVGKIILFVGLLTGIMILVTLSVGRLLGWSPLARSATVLGTAFMNAANYGLPVTLLALGQAGFERAAVFVVGEALMLYSVAVFFAARGRMSWRQSILSVVKLPFLWAASAALVMRLTGIQPPESVMTVLEMLMHGGIVLAILVLGMQVAGIRLKGARIKIAVATSLRLMVSPLIGLGIVALLRPDPLTAQVLVLQAAMPAAVNTTMLAVEFDAEPELVSGIALVTTLFSLATVSFWVYYLTG